VAARPAQRLDPAGRREESGIGILGVQADLDRMAATLTRRICRGLVEAERFAGGDPELVGHEVAAGDGLRDRVLDLESGVHLQEEEVAAVVEQKLARADAHVADRAAKGEGRLAEPAPEIGVDGG
jgi:hypothetical protein